MSATPQPSLSFPPFQPSKSIVFRHGFSPPSLPSIPPLQLPSFSSSLAHKSIRPQNQNQSYVQALTLSDLSTKPNKTPRNHGNHHFLFSHRRRCLLRLLRIATLYCDARLGRAAHAAIAKAKAKSLQDTRFAVALISMYANLSLLADAEAVFHRLPLPDVVAYTVLISGYAKHGREADAVRLFLRMSDSGIKPDEITYIAVSTACFRCGDLQLGSQIHAAVIKSRYVASVYVSSVVMGLYLKLGLTEDAVQVFDEMPEKDTRSWNTLILGLLQHLQHGRAFELFREMQMGGVRADAYTFASLFAALEATNDWKRGEEVHAHALRIGLETDVGVSNALLKFYATFGGLDNAVITMDFKLDILTAAQTIFDQLTSPNVISYTTLISAYAKHGREDDAVHLFFRMQDSRIEPDEFTYVAVLTACIRRRDLLLGSQIHAAVVKSNYIACPHVSSAVMSLYGKCQCSKQAARLFDVVPERDTGSWNAMISVLLLDLQHQQALELFRDMQAGGVRADTYTISSLLAASVDVGHWRHGKELHAHALRIGLESDVGLNNALFGFYARSGSIEKAVELFQRMGTKDVFSWAGIVGAYMNSGLVESAVEAFHMMPQRQRDCIPYNALLAGFCKNGEGSRALDYFRGMLEDEVEISDDTLGIVVNACALLSDLDKIKQLHGFVIKVGFGSNSRIETALLDMSKCDRMHDA
ncbi:hypothetical protein ACLOJK_020916 [Asimina triloba]